MTGAVSRSRAVYDLLSNAVRGIEPDGVLLSRASAAPARVWSRALRIEQCAPAAERALRSMGTIEKLPIAGRVALRRESARALRNALTLPGQLAHIAALADRAGIPFVALKGAARLLTGEAPGVRTMDDIDLLVRRQDARVLHAILATELRCTVNEGSPAHHLPCLYPATGLPIEVHVRLCEGESRLDDRIWEEAAPVACGERTVLVPRDTTLLLHALDHAVLTHWAMRYRLRDVLDVASGWREGIEIDEVMRHVRSSVERCALETLLAAAATIKPWIPVRSVTAWRTIGRVGRSRLSASFLSTDAARAERLLGAAGVIAEGSASAVARLARTALERRSARSAWLSLIGLILLAGCDSATGGAPPDVPPFVFASSAEGVLALYRYTDGAVARLTNPGSGDDEPHAALDRITFSSARDGNREVYMMPAAGGTARRITTDAAADAEPALRADAGAIAFVSTRSGTPRIYVVDTLGTTSAALVTGSPSFVPERSPTWSPAGDEMAFTSTRTGTSQVWIVSLAGGMAQQVTHETGGAFDPRWSRDGAAIHYADGSTRPRLMRVVIATGEASTIGEDAAGVGQPTCNASVCVGVRRPYTADADIVAFGAGSTRSFTVITRAGLDHRPALLSP